MVGSHGRRSSSTTVRASSRTLEDDLAGLERALANEFSEHHVETRGSFALFVARR
jgi:hypothetical protein